MYFTGLSGDTIAYNADGTPHAAAVEETADSGCDITFFTCTCGGASSRPV